MHGDMCLSIQVCCKLHVHGGYISDWFYQVGHNIPVLLRKVCRRGCINFSWVLRSVAALWTLKSLNSDYLISEIDV